MVLNKIKKYPQLKVCSKNALFSPHINFSVHLMFDHEP